MTKDRLKYLLDRYLDNTATPEELQEYNDWFEQQAGTATGEVFDQAEVHQLYERIMSSINRPAVVKRYIPYVKWAAAALITGAAFLLYSNIKTKPAATIAINTPLQDTLQQELVTIENNTSEQKLVRLKDGSLAALFTGSKLSYRKPFNTKDRNIYLSGKGYFDVAKDPARPFTVYSNGITTTALGTSFTVTAWPSKNEVTVLLHKGRVVVRDSVSVSKEVYLLPGQQVISCNIASGGVKFQPVTTANDNAGTMDKTTASGSRTGFTATFDQMPLDTVLSTIAKGYGVQLQYDREKMSVMLFSGSIKETDSLSQVLKRIGVLYNLSVKPAGRQIIIRKSH